VIAAAAKVNAGAVPGLDEELGPAAEGLCGAQASGAAEEEVDLDGVAAAGVAACGTVAPAKTRKWKTTMARVTRIVGALGSPRQEAGDASKSDGKKDCRTVLCMYIYMSGLRVRGVVGKPS